MNEYKRASKNDGYTRFDKEYACWASNHRGWAKAKKEWRKLGKVRIKREVSADIKENLEEIE